MMRKHLLGAALGITTLLSASQAMAAFGVCGTTYNGVNVHYDLYGNPCVVPYGPNTGGGGGGGSNAAAGTTGSAPPTSASYTGFLSGSSLVGVSATNPLPITGSISATNPSVGATGSATPGSATQLGFVSSGNLIGVSAASALPISVTNFPTTQAVSAASLPLPAGAATATGVAAVNTTLGTPFQAGGAISNTAFADTTLAAILTGGKVPTVSTAAQQTPAGNASVSVPASTSTIVWTTSTSARVLRLIPNNATCYMRDDGGTASATSTPVAGGYVFNLVEPPPNQNISFFCTTATTVAVAQGN